MIHWIDSLRGSIQDQWLKGEAESDCECVDCLEWMKEGKWKSKKKKKKKKKKRIRRRKGRGTHWPLELSPVSFVNFIWCVMLQLGCRWIKVKWRRSVKGEKNKMVKQVTKVLELEKRVGRSPSNREMHSISLTSSQLPHRVFFLLLLLLLRLLSFFFFFLPLTLFNLQKDRCNTRFSL